MFTDPETWVAVSFLLFAGLLVYLRVPERLIGALDKRSADIAKELEEARKLRQEAETVLAEYRKRSGEAQAEAETILAQAGREAAAYVKEARAAFDETIARRLRVAEQRIGQEEEKAREDIRGKVADLAIGAAEEIISRKLSGGLAEATVDTGIERIKKRLH